MAALEREKASEKSQSPLGWEEENRLVKENPGSEKNPSLNWAEWAIVN